MFFVFLLTVFISLESKELSCRCNSTSTTGNYCSAKQERGGKNVLFHDCKCKEGYSNLQSNHINGRITVFCEHSTNTSIRCFCDNKSAFSNQNLCIANIHPSGLIKYQSGCKCSHPLATPSIIPEFFYRKVMVVHCIWNRKEDIFAASNIKRFEYDKQRNFYVPKVRKVRQVAITVAATTATMTTSDTTASNVTTSVTSITTTSTNSTATSTSTTLTLSSGTTHNGTSVSTMSVSTSRITANTTTSTNMTNTSHSTKSTSVHSSTTTVNSTASTSHTTRNMTATPTTTHNTTITTHSTSPRTTTSNSTTTHTTSSRRANSTATSQGSSSQTSRGSTSNFTGTTISTKTTNSTRNTTKLTTTMPFWYIGNDTVDEDTFGVCNITKFTDKNKKTAEIMLYVASGWVVAWTALTIIYNVVAGVVGHHRFLDLFQELVIIIIFVFMGVFTLRPDWSTCEANKVVLHFCMMCILLIAIMQALFLSSLIKGKSSRNSRLPVMVNYIWPPFFAAVVAVVVYFAFKKYYDGNGVHCFCEIYEKLYWAYAFPAGILFMLALLNNQLAVTACRMTRQNVDRVQLYWARRTCRGMPILMAWFCCCFFCLLFAVDMQTEWLFGVYLGLCVIFGPMLFVFHTYCYEKSCRMLFETTGFTFYKPCPTKKGDPNHVEKVVEKTDLREKKPLTDPIIAAKPEKADLPPAPVTSEVVLPPPPIVDMPAAMPSAGIPAPTAAPGPVGPHNPTSSQDFYNWLTDKSTAPGQAENVLFKKNI